MQYTYTYNPLEDKRNDRTYRKKDVLMKCTKCGYEEEVPRWLIDELFPNEPEENYMMHCPECDHKMIVKKIIQQLKTNTKCRLFSIVLFCRSS